MAAVLEVPPDCLPAGASPLHLAANNEDIKTLTLLLADSVYDIDLADRHGRSPLVVALQNGRFSAAKVLIEYGASLDVRYGKEAVCVREALCFPVFLPLLEMLVEHGVHVNPSSSVTSVFAGLMHSVAYDGRVEFLKVLLEQYALDVDTKDNLDCTPLHYSVQRSLLDCVKVLLARGAKPGATNGLKLTCIHVACQTGNLEILQALMDACQSIGDLLNAQDCIGRTPLHIALYCSRLVAFTYLVSEYGSVIDTSLADVYGHTLQSLSFTVRFAPSSPPQSTALIPCMSREEATWLLHDSVAGGHYNGVNFALDHGAVIDCYDLMQQTPLLAAAKQGSLAVCETLVQRGAKVNLSDVAGRTPVHYAAQYGHSQVFSFLLSCMDVDLHLFYTLYDRPLSTDILQLLLAALESGVAGRPGNGAKWLSLAAACATEETFKRFAGYICQDGLVDCLLTEQTSDALKVLFKPVHLPGPFLSAFPSRSACEKRKNFPSFRRMRSYPPGSIFQSAKPSKKTAFKETRKHLQSPTLTFKTIPAAKKTRPPFRTTRAKWNKAFTLPPFHFHFSSRKLYSPLHDIVRHANVEVFNLILSQAGEDTFLKERLLSLKDKCGVMVLNRVAEKWMSFSSSVQRHALTGFVFEQLERQFPLPASLPLLVAVLLHIFADGFKKPRSALPLSTWPDWYVDLRLREEHNLSRLSLQHEDACKSFATPLVESGVYGVWHGLLLSAAVQHGCQWGAQLLLCQQPSAPSTSSLPTSFSTAGPHVLVQACRKCDTELTGLLLLYHDHPLLKLPDEEGDAMNQTMAELLQGLVTLANHGFVEHAELVLMKFVDIELAWSDHVRAMARLLYVILSSSNGQTFGTALINSLARHISRTILEPLSRDGFVSLFNTLQCQLHAFRRHNQSIELILQLVVFMRQYCLPTPSLTLHDLCSMGRLPLVRFLLLRDSSAARRLIHHLDGLYRSPLYYAACGGHVEIAKLVIERGYVYSGGLEVPPALGYLAHLSYAPHAMMPFQCLNDIRPCCFNKSDLQAVIKGKLMPSLVAPAYNISTEKVDPSEQKQLFSTLMDLSSHLLARLSALPEEYNCSNLQVLYVLAGIEDHSIIEPLLDAILYDLDSLNVRDIVLDLPHTPHSHRPPAAILAIEVRHLLDVIVAISSHHRSSKFESILAKCTVLHPLSLVHMSAHKGCWKLLLGCTLAEDAPRGWYGKALVEASLHGQDEVVTVLCRRYNYQPDLYLSRALRRAVANNHLGIVETLQNVSNSMALKTCAKYNNTEALQTVLSNTSEDLLEQSIEKLVSIAAKRSSTKILEYLLPLYCDLELMFGSEFADRNLSFWCLVLFNAAENGHQTLCLQAVACISDSQMLEVCRTIVDKFLKLLGWCCYWGMTDLLECLPYTSEQLLEPKECSAVESGIVQGQIGKLSRLKNFPSFEDAINTLENSRYFFKEKDIKLSMFAVASAMFSGAFHKLHSVDGPKPRMTKSETFRHEHFESLLRAIGKEQYRALFHFMEAVSDGHPEFVQVYVDHLGGYAAPLLSYIDTHLVHFFDLALSSKYDNVAVLEILLKAMFEFKSDKALISVGRTAMALCKAVQNGLVDCAGLLLRWGARNFTYPTSGTVLHRAVRSGSVELVTLLLNSLEGATELLQQKNVDELDPLTYAYSLGKGRIALELMKRMPSKADSMHSFIQFWAWVSPARGWFRELCKHSPSVPAPTLPSQNAIAQCHMNIRSCASVEQLFLAAAASNNYPVLEALFVGCGRDLPVINIHRVLDKLFTSSSFLQLLQNEQDSIRFERFTETKMMSGILSKCLAKLRMKTILQILKLFSVSISDHLPIMLTELFLTACAHKELELVQFLLDSQADLAENDDTLRNGLAQAICNGSYEVAGCLMLQHHVAYDRSCFPPGANPSQLVHTIFSSQSYHKLLDALFSSVIERGESERLPLASAWAVHKWTERQAQVVTRNLDGPCSPSNPWLLTVGGKRGGGGGGGGGGGSRDVVLIVDWDTFSECLLHSPLIGSTSSRFNPLLLETTIFSAAILGRIYESFSTTTDDCFSLTDQPLSSLILTCVLWPTKPSLSTFMEEQGTCILTISYNPQSDIFVFPKSAPPTSHNTDGSFSTDSGIQNESSRMFTDSELPEELQAIADSRVAAFKESTGYKTLDISVEFSDEFNCHFEDSAVVAATVDTALSDCFQILKLCQKPNVLYSRFHRQLCSMKLPVQLSVPKDLLNVQIHVCLVESGESDPQVTPLAEEDNQDRVTIILPISVSKLPPSVPSYEALLDMICERLLEGEVGRLKATASRSIGGAVVAQLKKSVGYFPLDADAVSLSVEDQYQVTRKSGNFNVNDLVLLKSLGRVKRLLSNFATMLKVFSFKPRLQSAVRRMLEAGLNLCITNELRYSKFFLKAGVAHITVALSDLYRGTSHLSLLDMCAAILQTSSVFKQTTFATFLSGIPVPFACAVDRDDSPGLLYPKIGGVGVVSVKLIGYDKKELTIPATSTCVLGVRIKTPAGKCLTGSSLEEPGLVPDKDLLAVINGSRAVLKWTPRETGLHHVSLKINETQISDGTINVFVPHPQDKRLTYQLCSNVEGSSGARTTTAGDPIVFIASQPCHPCSCSTSPPQVVLKGRKSVRAAVCSTSIKEGVAALAVETLSSSKPQHYISVYSFHGGAQNWRALSAGDVTVHLSRSKLQTSPKSQVSCVPLGRGFYRVALWTTVAGSFSVFASCAKCQAAMKIFWSDQQSMTPAPCYILPGPFSVTNSQVSLTPHPSGDNKKSRRKRKKKGALKVSVKAGGLVKLFLRARDAFGNPHTAGGTIADVVIPGAGLRPQTGMQQRLALGEDVHCKIEDSGDGLYNIEGLVFSSGTHQLTVMDQCGTAHKLSSVTLNVIPSALFASKCTLHFPSREATVGVRYTCFLYLFDQFGNPCPATYQNCGRYVNGVASGQKMGMSTLSEMSESVRMAPGLDVKPNCVVLSFTANSPGNKELLITVNDELVSSPPIVISVVRASQSFAAKIKQLRSQLSARYGSTYTPTITIDRASLLESAVNMLQEEHFRKVIRVRFGEEPGIDVGGPSREFFHLLCLELVNPQYALFQSVNGLYRPNPNSAVNPNHLFYFSFFGKVLAKIICDGHQMKVRFTPAVYKYLLKQECTLDDLKIEDPSLHTGLLQIMASESEEQLEQIALTFTASLASFGALETVELEQGGEHRTVTLANRHEFVHKLFSWHLTGCVQAQLSHLLAGFHKLIRPDEVESFLPHELEVLLSGPPQIDLAYIKRRTKYRAGYSASSPVVKWLWEILEEFSQEERSQFLQFTTGCPCHPSVDMGQWEFIIQRGSEDPSLLPVAATCFNSLSVPPYSSKALLREKLSLAISYGRESFLQS